MLAKLPWKAKNGRTITDKQIAGNIQASKLTQRLMSVTQRAVTAEKSLQVLNAKRSALFVSVEGRCIAKLENILEEFSACLTYAPTRWALMCKLSQRDEITPALARVNHQLERTGLRLDYHFAPTKPSHGRMTYTRPSTEEHWWTVPKVESVTISSDISDSEESKEAETTVVIGTSAMGPDAEVDLSYRWKKSSSRERLPQRRERQRQRQRGRRGRRTSKQADEIVLWPTSGGGG